MEGTQCWHPPRQTNRHTRSVGRRSARARLPQSSTDLSSSSCSAPRLKASQAPWIKSEELLACSFHGSPAPKADPIIQRTVCSFDSHRRIAPAACGARARAHAARSASRTPTAVRFFWRLGKFSPVRAHVFFLFFFLRRARRSITSLSLAIAGEGRPLLGESAWLCTAATTG